MPVTLLRKSLFPTLTLLAYSFCSHSVPGAEASARTKVSVTFVANEGILINGSNARVLIDGIFDKSYGAFQVPAAETLAKLKSATSPFDHLTAMLATHRDLDHINPAFVGQHLVNDPSCAFLAPAETVDLVRPLPEFSQFENRVHALAQDGTESETIIKKVKIRAIPLGHMPRPPSLPEMPFNVGYLCEVDGITFFHTGDMSAENLPALQRAKLAEANIDVLLISWYAFKPNDGSQAQGMIQYLHPKVVLLAHLTTKNAATEKALVEKLAGLPSVIPLDTPLRTYEFEKTGEIITVK